MPKNLHELIYYSLFLLCLCFVAAAFPALSFAGSAEKTYYIDVDSIGGPCNNSYTPQENSITKPWCSFRRKFWDDRLTLAPGDTLNLRGGTYFEEFRLHPNSAFSGTVNNPITIRAFPGESVVVDGSPPASRAGEGLYIGGNHSFIHLIGPIEVKHFGKCLESNSALVNDGWVIDGLNAHHCRIGLKIRKFHNLTLKNSIVHDTNGDGKAGGIFISGGSTNITIENVKSYNHNDGRGIDGDADGFWAHQSTGSVTMKNVEAYNNSEDGFDIKGANISITNAKSYDNTTVGFKLWFGHYDVFNFLAYNNGEDGVKCSQADVNISNLVSTGNLESGFQFRSVGCTGRIQNSIFSNNKDSAVELARLSSGETVDIDWVNNIFYHAANPARTIVVSSCGVTFSDADIGNGTFDTTLQNGINCGGSWGTISGSAQGALVQDPLFINAPAVAKSRRISAATTGLATVQVYVLGDNPWPGYNLGDLLELNSDNVLRRITAVDSVNHIVSFTDNPLPSPYQGRMGDGKGVRITDWGTSSPFNVVDNYRLLQASPAIDSALSTGAPATDIEESGRFDHPAVQNSGSGPLPYFDRGVYEYQPLPPPPPAGCADKPDNDGDGACDADEISAGSDPNDPGSYPSTLSSPTYTYWNGFLQMTNILELVNGGASDLTATVRLFTIDGSLGNTLTLTIAPLNQRDLIINDMPGFSQDSFGVIRIDFQGELDGRVSFYRSDKSSNGFEFAFSVPFSNPSFGKTAVAFNTFQPSNNPNEHDNLVANWLTVVNLANTPKDYTLNQYNQLGEFVSTKSISVAPFGRIDVHGGHENGPSLVGLDEIIPADSHAPYLAQLIRYGTNAPPEMTPESFSFAFPLAARAGNGRPTFAPISSRLGASNWLEVINSSSASVTADIEFIDSTGSTRGVETVVLEPRGQRHYHATSFLEPEDFGYAVIRSSAPNSIISQSMLYFRAPDDGKIMAMYGSQGKETLGDNLHGSYNLFLAMENHWRISNLTDTTLPVTVVINSQTWGVPNISPHASIELSLDDAALFGTNADTYGVASVTFNTTGAVLSEVVRLKKSVSGELQFAVPIPLR